tara:strand:- start:254 stop:1333 length:1080 start_codon:yes stop_codon:yes gene_type:complete
MRFRTAQTERLRIASDGDVGIGTDNPTDILDINSDSASAVTNMYLRNHANLGGAALNIWTQGTYSSPTYKAIIGCSDAGGNIRMGAHSNHDLLLLTNNTARLIIKNDGIVNIGVSSPQYAKKLNVQGGNDSQISVSNQDYTGHAAGSMSGIEGRLQCGNSVWSSAGIRFKKENGTIGDKHTTLELYATDGYANKTGLIVQPDGYVTKPLQPAFCATRNGASHIQLASNPNLDIIFPTVDFDNSNSYDNSNGRFTAPVAGKYYFGIQFYCGFSVTSVRVMHATWKKNGSVSHTADLFGGIGNFGDANMNHYHPTTNAHVMLDLAVGDYVTFNTGTNSFIGSGNTYLYATKGTRFFGHLVA